DPLIAAQEELVLEVRFQRGDVLTERWLRDAQRVGGSRHAARIDDRHEALEFLEVDAHSTTVGLRGARMMKRARLSRPCSPPRRKACFILPGIIGNPAASVLLPAAPDPETRIQATPGAKRSLVRIAPLTAATGSGNDPAR